MWLAGINEACFTSSYVAWMALMTCRHGQQGNFTAVSPSLGSFEAAALKPKCQYYGILKISCQFMRNPRRQRSGRDSSTWRLTAMSPLL